MDIEQIKSSLNSEDPQARMRGLTALRHYSADVAAPLLLSRVDDPEVIVRSFVAMGLGYKQSEAGFAKLLEVMEEDADANVRAEAAGALSKYGAVSVEHLVRHFYQDQHWLSQISVILALADLDCPVSFLEVCRRAIQATEPAIRNTAIETLPYLAQTPYQDEALQLILSQATHEDPTIRRQVALALRAFSDDRARTTLQQLRQDPDHRVVAAALENLLPST